MGFSQTVKSVIDCHVHLYNLEGIGNLSRIRRELGFDAINLASLCDPVRGSSHCQGLVAKLAKPGEFYCFGGLNHAGQLSGGKVAAPALPEQVDNILASGCDGIKLLESKPTSRRRMNLPLDGQYYADFLAHCQQRDVPLLWHVADPEEFWDEKLVPKWAVQHGWNYGPSDVAKEQLYAEVENVLSRYPRLRVIFAHFYFLSADLDRAERFLAAHPNANLDLAPGIELLFNMSRDVARSREFFIKHQNRILFGTDIACSQQPAQARARADLVRRFMETAEAFGVTRQADSLLEPDGQQSIRGLDLPVAALEKIYAGNFRRIVGDRPRELDKAQVMAECRRQADIAAQLSGQAAADTPAGQCAAEIEKRT